MLQLHSVTTPLLLSFLLLGGEAKKHGADKDDAFRVIDTSETRPGPTSADYLVEGLEEVEPAFGTFDGIMHAGLVSVHEDIHNDEKGKLMFWMFDKHDKVVDDTLLIWFNGGPGCSSFHAGMLLEMGPATVPLQPAGSFGQPALAPHEFNAYAWSNVTTLMYVEQPVGTGFSYGAEAPQDEEGVSQDFYNFLQNFYKIFPEHSQKRLYLVGESYAGYYVPGIAHYIYLKNKQKKRPHVPLSGLALGNGWADVADQGGMVIDYAYWHGMIDSVQRDAFHVEYQHCLKRTGNEPDPFHPFTTPDECGMVEAVLAATGAGLFEDKSPNMYDVTTWDRYWVLNARDNANTRFFNNPDVQAKLNVPKDIGKKWEGCIVGAGRRRQRRNRRRLSGMPNEDELLPGQKLLMHDKPENMAPYLADLIDDAKIQVLVYNGDRDLSTCAQGSEVMLNGMAWSGHEDWLSPHKYSRSLWMVDDYVGGWSKSVPNKTLEFLIVYNSGHLVPYNVPIPAMDLVTRLVTNKPFGDVEIPVVYETKNAIGSTENEPGALHGLRHSFFPSAVGFVLGIAVTYLFGRRNKRSDYQAV